MSHPNQRDYANAEILLMLESGMSLDEMLNTPGVDPEWVHKVVQEYERADAGHRPPLWYAWAYHITLGEPTFAECDEDSVLSLMYLFRSPQMASEVLKCPEKTLRQIAEDRQYPVRPYWSDYELRALVKKTTNWAELRHMVPYTIPYLKRRVLVDRVSREWIEKHWDPGEHTLHLGRPVSMPSQRHMRWYSLVRNRLVGVTLSDIARQEGVSHQAISSAVQRVTRFIRSRNDYCG